MCSLCIHACACEEFFFLPPSSLRLDSKFVLSTSTAPHSAFFAFPRGLCAVCSARAQGKDGFRVIGCSERGAGRRGRNPSGEGGKGTFEHLGAWRRLVIVQYAEGTIRCRKCRKRSNATRGAARDDIFQAGTRRTRRGTPRPLTSHTVFVAS